MKGSKEPVEGTHYLLHRNENEMTRYLITSALPYINGIKHLGNLAGSMLPADIFARFLRQEGEEVLFICATDEHGAPAELAALEEGMGVKEYCEKQHELQKDVYARFRLSFDCFGRSSSVHNHKLTKEIFEQLDRAGFIEARDMEGIYSASDNMFLPDRYIIGTCPECGYESARGDQCENCSKLLDPTDLVSPRSVVSGSTQLEKRTSRHLFLRLSALQPTVEKWVKEIQSAWPPLTSQIAWKWLNEGLHDRCITRDLPWGVNVPKEGFESKVFYVWFDAPIAYIGATWQWAEETGNGERWKEWWVDGSEVKYYQFMGKDNLPFHTVMFPATLLGSGHNWKLADQIKGFHWMNYYGGKFSTSRGRGIFMDDALEILASDYWRYFLVANSPETSDSDFTWERFSDVVNKDLANTLGNFVNRVLKFTTSKFGNSIPAGGAAGDAESVLAERCAEQVEKLRSSFGNLEYRAAATALRTLWKLGNTYIDESAPWASIKTDRDRTAMVIRTCFNLIRLFAAASRPILPDTAETIMDALMLDEKERAGSARDHLDLTLLAAGRPFNEIPPIFAKITPEQVTAFEKRFGSSED
jgi:methionyl-tRNA synthetase